jgi:hypothetical protein
MAMASRVEFQRDPSKMAALKSAYERNNRELGIADFAALDTEFGFHQPGTRNTGYYTHGILTTLGVHKVGRSFKRSEPAPAPVPVPAPVEPAPADDEHKMYALLRLIVKTATNKSGHCMLVGPAGSGKTYNAEKLALELGFKYYPFSVGPQTSKSDLIGYMDAGGNYRTTAFREAYEKGGVLLLDEVDAGNPAILTMLNAAIANGKYYFPDNRLVEAHADFRCIAAGNTWGLGADSNYNSRQKMDAATLSRFVRLEWPYDERHELAISPCAAWTRNVQKARKAAANAGLRTVICPRQSINGGLLVNAGMKWADVEKVTFLAGLDAASVKKLRDAMAALG